MRSFMNLQVLGACEHLAACRERTGERLLPRMYPDMIDQLVFRLERPSIPRTPVPETRMRRALRSADMLHGEMRDDLVHVVEHLAACLARPGRVYPQTCHVLLDGLPHVAEERPMRAGRLHGICTRVGSVEIHIAVHRLPVMMVVEHTMLTEGVYRMVKEHVVPWRLDWRWRHRWWMMDVVGVVVSPEEVIPGVSCLHVRHGVAVVVIVVVVLIIPPERHHVISSRLELMRRRWWWRRHFDPHGSQCWCFHKGVYHFDVVTR